MGGAGWNRWQWVGCVLQINAAPPKNDKQQGGVLGGPAINFALRRGGGTLLREEETTLGTPMMTVSAGTGWLAGVSVMADRLALGVDLVEMLILLWIQILILRYFKGESSLTERINNFIAEVLHSWTYPWSNNDLGYSLFHSRKIQKTVTSSKYIFTELRRWKTPFKFRSVTIFPNLGY